MRTLILFIDIMSEGMKTIPLERALKRPEILTEMFLNVLKKRINFRFFISSAKAVNFRNRWFTPDLPRGGSKSCPNS